MKPALISKPRSWQRFAAIPVMLGLIGLMTASPALTQEKERMLRTLTVTGRGTEEIPTTLTQIRLGVEAQGKTANEVQQQVARRANAVVTLLKSRQVEDLETTGVNLGPLYRYDNGNQQLVGYTASNIVSFKIQTTRVGTLLDDAVKAGASRVDGISFTATDEAIAAAQRQALQKATQDAQKQADAVFSTLNLTRKDVVSIQINGAFTPPPPQPRMEAAQFAKVGDASTPIIGGEQRVEGSVTLQISY